MNGNYIDYISCSNAYMSSLVSENIIKKKGERKKYIYMYIYYVCFSGYSCYIVAPSPQRIVCEKPKRKKKKKNKEPRHIASSKRDTDYSHFSMELYIYVGY